MGPESSLCCHAGNISQPVNFLKCKSDHVPIENSPTPSLHVYNKVQISKLYKVLHDPASANHWIAYFTTFYLLYSLCSNLSVLIRVALLRVYLLVPFKKLFPSFLHGLLPHFIQVSVSNVISRHSLK